MFLFPHRDTKKTQTTELFNPSKSMPRMLYLDELEALCEKNAKAEKCLT